jgi:hypothetical protein
MDLRDKSSARSYTDRHEATDLRRFIGAMTPAIGGRAHGSRRLGYLTTERKGAIVR